MFELRPSGKTDENEQEDVRHRVAEGRTRVQENALLRHHKLLQFQEIDQHPE